MVPASQLTLVLLQMEPRSALPLWQALRVRTLHRAEIFALQSRVPALADYKTRL